MQTFDGWEPIGEPLGKGGQGTVYRARNPERVNRLMQCAATMLGQLNESPASINRTKPTMLKFAQSVVELGSDDPVAELGALKKFAIPTDDKDEEQKAIGRLESEIQALQQVHHPAVLKLLHANAGQRFIVTEYHPCGTLNQHLKLYRGTHWPHSKHSEC